MQEKACKSCGVTKSVDEFYKSHYVTKEGKQSYSHICKDCQKKVSAESNKRRMKDPAKRLDNAKWHREWRKKTGKLTGRKGGKPSVVVDGKRPCRKCGEVKTIDEFHTRNGYPYYICILCERAATNERLAQKWREQHPAKTSLCPVCNTKFVHTKKQKFCSPECRQVSINLSKRKPPRQKRTECKECGKQEIKANARCTECLAAKRAKRHQEHKAYYRQKSRERQMRIEAAEGSHTDLEWEALKAHYSNRCLCCGKAEPEVELTRDHVIPLVKGGTNSIDNIQPLCRGCNSRKRNSEADYR